MSRPSPLERLFNPSSIAIVGASTQSSKAGYQMLKSLAGFAGRIYPINPSAETILGFAAYTNLRAVPAPIDLVILTIPAEACAGVLASAGELGAGGAIVISGGFADIGEAGVARQDDLLSTARQGGVRLLGPNTSGFIAPARGLRATFAPGAETLEAGGLAIVAQSGGINLALAFIAKREGFGVRLAVGLGNAADVGAADVLDYLADDAATKAIALHLEGVSDGRRMFETLRRVTRIKPVVALPVGRTAINAFARSHTGNLLGDFALTRAALVQAGAVVVDTTDDLIDAAATLASVRLEPKRRPGVGIVTGQAGPGLLIADALNAANVAIPELSEPTVARIRDHLPPLTYMRNPVDTGRPGASFASVLEIVARDGAIDALLVYALHEPDALDAGEVLSRTRGALDKPLVFGTGAAPDDAQTTMAALWQVGVPSFGAPDRAARAMRALVADAEAAARNLERIGTAAPTVAAPVRGPLDEAAAKALIAAAGIACPRHVACASHGAAHDAFATLGGPAVVKVLNPAIAHKTEAGGVHVGIEDVGALRRALAAIDAIPGGPHRYLVEEMAPPGIELILGARRDASWGASVLVGLGGIAAEALGDVAIRLAPLARDDAEEMLRELRGRALIDGWRGAPVADRAKLIDAIVAIGGLIASHPEISELDINPLRASQDGRLLALDALVVL